jgi:hypothetical protein
MPVAVDTDALGDARVHPLRPSPVVGVGAIDKQDARPTPSHDGAPSARPCPIDVPQAYAAVIQGRYGQQRLDPIVLPGVVRAVEGDPSRLDNFYSRGVVGKPRHLKPVHRDGALALNVLVVPRDTLRGEGRVPVCHDPRALPCLDPGREPEGGGAFFAIAVTGECGGARTEDPGRYRGCGDETVKVASTVEGLEEGRVAKAPPAPQLLVAGDGEEAAGDKLQVACLCRFETWWAACRSAELGRGGVGGFTAHRIGCGEESRRGVCPAG